MLWLKLVEGILDLDIVQKDVCLRHTENRTSIDFLTAGKLRFTVEINYSEVSLVFREYGAEAFERIRGGKFISNSVYGQEQEIIKRIKKILRRVGLFFSFDEINEKELKWREERKVVWNKGYVNYDDGDE